MTLCTRMEYYVYKKLCTAQFQLKTALNSAQYPGPKGPATPWSPLGTVTDNICVKL